MEKSPLIVKSIGPGVFTHNYVCAVCCKNSAVYYSNKDVLLPCWDCMKSGYFLVKANRFVIWILTKLGIIL